MKNKVSPRAAVSKLTARAPLHHVQKVGSFWTDFRTFAFSGNLIDLAVGIVVGTSFKELTSSFVENIVMPPIGVLLGNADFSQLYIGLTGQSYGSLAEAQAANAPVIAYGAFLTNLIDFLLVALSMYLVLRFVLRHQFGGKAEGKK